jgi:hypothetical protein
VKAFERLHIVRARNSSCLWSFPPIWRKDEAGHENTTVFFVNTPHSGIISSLHRS